MAKLLKIANGVSLPLETVTQAIGILAKRRAGKSYAMRRLAEQLFNAGQQIVIVDPKGDQWGIRSSVDGKGPGLPVVILGGERADVPLEANSGEVVAKLVVEDRVSVLLDLSLFRKHEVATFMAAFLESLYRLKAREIYRTPVMLIIDEADAIAPQKPQKGEERMLGAAEDIVRRGGQRGIGCTLVTQRSAVINKNVLTQIQILITLRTIAPQDLAAIDAWIDVHGTDEERKTLKSSLPSLPVGDAWIWSPGWPTVDGIFERVHVLPIETFDSGATPKPGEKRIEPKNLADVDLNVLKKQMAATIEKARAENPKELKKKVAEGQKRIAELEHKLAQPGTSPKPETITVEKPVLKDGQLARAEKILASVGTLTKKLSTVATEIRDAITKVNTNGHKPVQATNVRTVQAPVSGAPSVGRTINLPARTTAAVASGELDKFEVTLLRKLADRSPVPTTRSQLFALSGFSIKSSNYPKKANRLVETGHAEDVDGGLIITDAGRESLGEDYQAAPASGSDALAYWINKLPAYESGMLSAIARSGELSSEDIAQQTNRSLTSSAFPKAIKNLQGLQFIEGDDPYQLGAIFLE